MAEVDQLHCRRTCASDSVPKLQINIQSTNITNTDHVEITDQTDHIPISVFLSSVREKRSDSSVLPLVSAKLQLPMIPCETLAVNTCVPQSTVHNTPTQASHVSHTNTSPTGH